jgi:GalNAc-alpha-(1->4)-GalNAc-alpha-(1->3)-diNAcBac-PP-undecaprenol alpha-1,4-N-acetyl-D-galactosaminyltransferase
MRIVLLTSSLDAGGAERVATTLCNAWVARGDEIILIPTFSGGGRPFYSLSKKIKLIYLADEVSTHKIKLNTRKNYMIRLKILRNIIVRHNPSLVISFLPNVNIAAIGATIFTRIPCIICERSDPTIHPISPFWSIACRLFYRFADAVTVQTQSVAQRIGEVYPRLKRVTVMPNPLPEELMAMEPRDPDATPNDGRQVLLSVGRLSAEKRPNRIIHAFAALAGKYPTWDLHLIGDGPMRQGLARQIEACGLAPGRVKLLGKNPDPWPAMKKADAFILASAYEGFPNALLEAVALGVPSISTDCRSGPREISDDGRALRLVPPDDDRALTLALDEFLGDPALRRQLSEAGAASVRARFELGMLLRQWDTLFDQVIKDTGASRPRASQT